MDNIYFYALQKSLIIIEDPSSMDSIGVELLKRKAVLGTNRSTPPKLILVSVAWSD